MLDQLARRQVRPTRHHNAEVQRLLTLMGIPWVIVRSKDGFSTNQLTNRHLPRPRHNALSSHGPARCAYGRP